MVKEVSVLIQNLILTTHNSKAKVIWKSFELDTNASQACFTSQSPQLNFSFEWIFSFPHWWLLIFFVHTILRTSTLSQMCLFAMWVRIACCVLDLRLQILQPNIKQESVSLWWRPGSWLQSMLDLQQILKILKASFAWWRLWCCLTACKKKDLNSQ